ncbi:MAG: hypothetical protein NE327_20985, partial [Lentisphaeraceae bacterium]|nr:hypothetical protein [Lentisphaeraceae bacterium]
MSSFVNRDINTPYVLKAEHVKSIWDVVRDKIGAPTIELECKDHISRSYTSLNKFKKFENTPQKEIQKLMIRAKSDDYSKHVRVQFSGSRWRTVNIEINGSETIVTNIQDALMDILEDTRPWYSLFSKIDVSNISFIICSFLFMVSYIKKADSAGITSSTKLTTTEAILATAVLGLTVVALI